MGATLHSPRLRRILVAYTVNRLGTWIGLVALSVVVYDHTHNALAVAALLLAGQILPAFAVPFLVVRVERSQRRGELSALYFFEAAVASALAALVASFWLPAFLLLAALDGTAALAASALLRAQVARIAREDAGPARAARSDAAPEAPAEVGASEREHAANAAVNAAFSVTFVIGPALGGVLVASAGAASALLIDAASFVACGLLLLDLKPHVEEALDDSVRARLKAAVQHLAEVPLLKRVLIVEAIALVFFEAAAPVELPYVKAALHGGNPDYGLLMSSWGAGVVVGSVVFARAARRPLSVLLALGALAVGLAYLGFAAAQSVGVACAAAVVGGLGQGIQWASLISSVQLLTPQRLQGRMMGAVESIGAISPPFGLLLGGGVAVLSSPRVAMLVVGTGAVLTTPAFARLRVPAPRSVDALREPLWTGLGEPEGANAPVASRPTGTAP